MRKRVYTVVGARPQFIKAAVVSSELAKSEVLEERLVHTGQHYDREMSEDFFAELRIPPPYASLNVGSNTPGRQTAAMVAGLEEIFLRESPDLVLVYGDTNSTLAGALVAAKLGIPLVHVEAGLRSYERSMPEEINRRLTDHCADLLLTPTDTATRNLLSEGIPRERIVQVGDVMLDLALTILGRPLEFDPLLTFNVQPKEYFLATIHRQENTDNESRLETILRALVELNRLNTVILPLHPRTRDRIHRNPVLRGYSEKLKSIPPVGYFTLSVLERNARVVLTDSGGVQKEAFFHRVPCVILREATEWVELIQLGWSILIPPTDSQRIVQGAMVAVGMRGKEGKPFGEGDAAVRVGRLLEQFSSGGESAHVRL